MIKTTASVCKLFYKLNREEIDKYSENIYYVIGNPIHVSQAAKNMFETFVSIKYRQDISDKEIYDSFINTSTNEIMLFSSEYAAYKYSETLAHSIGYENYQSAIFKVMYFDSVCQNEIKQLRIEANGWSLEDALYWKPSSDGLIFNADYLIALKDKVIPMEGLSVHLDSSKTT